MFFLFFCLVVLLVPHRCVVRGRLFLSSDFRALELCSLMFWVGFFFVVSFKLLRDRALFRVSEVDGRCLILLFYFIRYEPGDPTTLCYVDVIGTFLRAVTIVRTRSSDFSRCQLVFSLRSFLFCIDERGRGPMPVICEPSENTRGDSPRASELALRRDRGAGRGRRCRRSARIDRRRSHRAGAAGDDRARRGAPRRRRHPRKDTGLR